ncbi:DEAD/DEAH box helicase [Salsipaludibacter albus]|uniref:DEAD/DEAH box helicase n=1 Tax=Salsipaludibacter albus TaxID=2849650 RepID=UPI001EE48A76|nr:ATP-binding domain-containing protein [Salsipaludibacter albus]MBY5161460.1 ATP-binding domain-containing protein [Salsipaludibacter albus]
MTLNVVQGSTEKPVAAELLVEALADSDVVGQLFTGYPIIGSAAGKTTIDATLVSPDMGVVVFDLVEGPDLTGTAERQDDAANKLVSRLITNPGLVDRRSLKIPVSTLSFAPATQGRDVAGDYPVAQKDTVLGILEGMRGERLNDELYRTALSAIQSISTIRSARQRRQVRDESSRGAILKRLEDSIATLDNQQSAAVIESVDDVQRIRGLAGSGKTIVLALKAAYLHAQHPDWRIAVTFNTRSLKNYFKRLITNFSLEQVNEEPDWENLRILNAWGAAGGPEREGIYHEYCSRHAVRYLDFGSAKQLYGFNDAFSGAVADARSRVTNPKKLYDAILVDEAQDLPPAFLRICYDILGPEKRLVYAYDELQDLHGKGLPPAEQIFGADDAGRPRVSFSTGTRELERRDIILEKCYRNSRPVLISAHAVGFGIYREPADSEPTGLVQIFDEPDLWRDIGYHVESGPLAPGERVVLARTPETSPRFLEAHSDPADLVSIMSFPSRDAQDEWVAESIRRNIEQEELRHDDIMVINTDPLTTRENLGPLRKRLLQLGIDSHLAGVDADPDVFFSQGDSSVTFTGIHRAKGNECGMVYVVNAEETHSARRNLARIRNRLFTAITRSKAWVRVCGVGPQMEVLGAEFLAVREHEFVLDFVYPTDEMQKQLRIVHRDMSPDEERKLAEKERSLSELLQALRSGNLYVEDLDPGLRDEIVRLLSHEE